MHYYTTQLHTLQFTPQAAHFSRLYHTVYYYTTRQLHTLAKPYPTAHFNTLDHTTAHFTTQFTVLHSSIPFPLPHSVLTHTAPYTTP